MKRRAFLSLTSLAAPVSSLRAAEAPPLDSPEDLWWPMVKEVQHFRTVSPEGRLVLEVCLATPGEEELEVVAEGGEVVEYRLRGRRLLAGYYPGVAVIDLFSLTWDGRPIAVPPRFWADLAGFRLQTLSVEPASLDSETRAMAEKYTATLLQPRVVLSADKGTALVEWMRQEDHDARSTFRWLISRSGTVLRHRHLPGHEG